MDIKDAIETRLEVRDYADGDLDRGDLLDILDAGRLAPSGRNTQHWRFILIEDDDRLAELADRSPSGDWVRDAAAAIAICTDPQYAFHEIDAGRAVTHMQLRAWELDIASCIYTVDRPEVDELLDIPDEYELTLVAAFGQSDETYRGIKDRKPLSKVAFEGTFGTPLEPEV